MERYLYELSNKGELIARGERRVADGLRADGGRLSSMPNAGCQRLLARLGPHPTIDGIFLTRYRRSVAVTVRLAGRWGLGPFQILKHETDQMVGK